MGASHFSAVKRAIREAVKLLRVAHDELFEMRDNRELVSLRDWERLVELVNLACAEAEAVRYGVCEYEHLEVIGVKEERKEV